MPWNASEPNAVADFQIRRLCVTLPRPQPHAQNHRKPVTPAIDFDAIKLSEMRINQIRSLLVFSGSIWILWRWPLAQDFFGLSSIFFTYDELYPTHRI
jgi:hypothetical protein